MPYRFLVALIALFWLVMTGLLVQLRLNPSHSEALAVPPSYVFGLMFLHGEESSLQIFDKTLPVGKLTLRPAMVPGKKLRVLDFSGSVSLQLPMASRQRFNFLGHIHMNQALQMRGLDLDFSTRQPPLRVQLSVDDQQHVQYELNQNGVVDHGKLSGLKPENLPVDLGIDPAALQSVQQNMESVTYDARRVEFKVRGEKTDAFLITVHYGTTILAEIYISELGQILLAKTPGGYTFAAEDNLQ